MGNSRVETVGNTGGLESKEVRALRAGRAVDEVLENHDVGYELVGHLDNFKGRGFLHEGRIYLGAHETPEAIVATVGHQLGRILKDRAEGGEPKGCSYPYNSPRVEWERSAMKLGLYEFTSVGYGMNKLTLKHAALKLRESREERLENENVN